MFESIKPERVVSISDALRIEWYTSSSIVVYIVSKISSPVLQTWSELAVNILKQWPPEKPYLALYDLSNQGVVFRYSLLAQQGMFSLGITDQGEARVRELLQERQAFRSKIAMCVSMRESGFVGGALASLDAQRTLVGKNTIQYDVFHDRNAAFRWLYADVK